MLTDMASFASQLSLVAEGIRIKISLSPSSSAVQTYDLLDDFEEGAGVGTFPISIEGTTARLFGPGARAMDCVTVIVFTVVFASKDVVTDVMLGGGADEIDEAV